MKVVIIHNLYPPFGRGGAEKLVVEQVEKNLAQGNEVVVITTHPQAKISLPKNLTYKIYYLPAGNIFSFYNLNQQPVFLRAIWRLIDIFNLSIYFKVKNILKAEQPALIYAHNLTGLSYLLPRLFKKMRFRYIQYIHDVSLIRPSGLLIYGHEKENLTIKLYAFLTRYLFNSPNQVIFPSVWIKNYYKQHNFFTHSQKEVIKNFNLSAKNLLSQKKLKQSSEITFLYLGQIEKHKGILFLIRSFIDLPQEAQLKSKLLIVGGGKLLDEAKKIAAKHKNIIFYGQQPAAKVKAFLPQADYLIVPSLCYENSPTVIFEALNNNLPVIASNLGGIAELVREGENGYLFKPSNTKTLSNLLIKIFKQYF